MKRLFSAACLAALLASGIGQAGSYPKEGDLPEWTMLIFLNADNNLYSAGLDDMKEMEEIGSTDRVNVVVQFDGSKDGDSARYLIERDKEGSAEIISKAVEELGEVDMGDWHNLVGFALWGIERYPAKRYFIDVWNHGSGWLKSSPILTGISYDDGSGNHISTPELGEALKTISEKLGKKIDIYGSDACLMQMLEVGFEIKGYAGFMVGSEETEPGDGWPYDDFLQGLNGMTDKDPRAVAELLVDAYGKSYSQGSQGSAPVTLSAIDLAAVDKLALDLNVFAGLLLARVGDQKTKIVEAIGGTQGYSYAENKDIYDFTLKLGEALGDDRELAEASAALQGSLNRSIVKSVYVDPRYDGSHGLAIWMPSDVYGFEYYKENYSELKLARDTGWIELLAEINKKTGSTI